LWWKRWREGWLRKGQDPDVIGLPIADSVLDLSPPRVAVAGAIAISGKRIKEDLATWRRCRH
jgi:hypothetical protein